MTTTTSTTADAGGWGGLVDAGEPLFTEAERVALNGFLAGYSG